MIRQTRRAIMAAALAADDGASGATPGTSPGDSEPLTVQDDGRSVDAVISALASVPVELGRLLDGRSGDDLMRPAQDGGWGLVEIVPHLRDWEVIYADRLDQIMTETPATVQEYDDSLWAIEHGYREMDPHEVFQEFASLRVTLVERLQALHPDDWQRVVVLPKRGRVTLHWLMSTLFDHDTKHLVQARDVLT